MNKSISVCIPLYNVPIAYLNDLLFSLTKQTIDNFEVIIVDDNSMLDYMNVIEKYSGKLNVEYVKNIKNIGMVKNWNKSVELSTGEYIIVLGHDDIIMPTMLEKYLKIFNNNPDVALVSSCVEDIDGAGNLITFPYKVNHRKYIFKNKSEYKINRCEIIYLCLRNGAVIGELSVQMFKRADFTNVGGYKEDFKHAADLDFGLQILNAGKFYYINDILVRRRMHKNNLTWKHLSSGDITRDRAKLHSKYFSECAFSEIKENNINASMCGRALHDLIRIVNHRSIKTTSLAFRQLLVYCRVSPVFLIKYMGEVVRKINIDEK